MCSFGSERALSDAIQTEKDDFPRRTWGPSCGRGGSSGLWPISREASPMLAMAQVSDPGPQV